MNYSRKMHFKFPAYKGFKCDRAPARADLLRRKNGNAVMN